MGGGGKLLLPLRGRTVLYATAELFCAHPEIDSVLVVCPPGGLAPYREALAGLPAHLCEGGATRAESVQKGLSCLPAAEEDLVLVHDGARPFASPELISRLLMHCRREGSAVTALPVTDTIKRVQQGRITTLPREELFAAQTPQVFPAGVLRRAYENTLSVTDDAQAVELLGLPVSLAAGEATNKKLTTPADLPPPALPRTGLGMDVHAFAEGRPLILGGVTLPYHKGLLGHSDADVLCHAIMDALLGAAGLPDVGRQFPDTDNAYKNISSLLLLQRTGELVRKAGCTIGNIDAVVAAQAPKIAPYIEEIKSNLASALQITPGQVHIKGTTTEELGFVGRREGILALATCLVVK